MRYPKRPSLAIQLALMVAVTGLITQWAAAQDAARTSAEAEANFQRGYYLQTLKNDPAGAVAAFEKVVADAATPADMRSDATLRLAQCREDVAAADLSRLLPADAIAALEINRPGAHVGNLARMLGLVRTSSAERAVATPVPAPAEAKPAEVKPNAGNPDRARPFGGIPLEAGFVLPDDFSISPALLKELEKVRGVAVAMTSLDSHGRPEGVAVIHPGESDLLRGLAETGIQFIQPAEPIEGFRTYQIQNELWLVQTSRLFIASRSKAQASAAAARLKNPGGDSLATKKSFQRLEADRKGSLAFLYVAGDQIAPLLISQGGFQEAMIARSVADLDHLDSLSAAARTTDQGIVLQAKASLAEGHRNLAYALIRTAPTSRRTLERVPAGVAAVGILGLNPAQENAAPYVSSKEPRYVSAMDLGREVFANIEEVSVFVMPSSTPSAKLPMPEVGLVFGVKDPQASEALWDQLLSLPALFGMPLTSAPTEVTIEGQKGRQFRFPYIPPVVLVAQNDRTFLAGTSGAVAAAIRVGSGKQDSIAKDPQLGSLVAALPKHTSKGAVVHVGRTMRTVAPAMAGEMPPDFATATSAFDSLTLSLVTDEHPIEFAIRAEAKGLPDVMQFARTFGAARLAHEQRIRAEIQVLQARQELDRVRGEARSAETRTESARDRVEKLDQPSESIRAKRAIEAERTKIEQVDRVKEEQRKALETEVEGIRREQQKLLEESKSKLNEPGRKSP